MKKLIKCIYLVWRKGRGGRRIAVGVIRMNQTEGATFKYLPEGVKKALADGFTAYPDFPDIDKTYANVMEVFGQRLNNSERADIQNYYNYWEISSERKSDKYYILAQTQGLLPTDNFEFIAEYYLTKELKFISEICGLSVNPLPSEALKVNEELQWKLEKDNPYDKDAVVILKNGKKIGYVKKIHNKVFHGRYAKNLRIHVKSLDQNGHINRAFIKISQL